MECVYWSFFLLNVISTTPLVSSRPNMHDLSKTKVHHGNNAADFLPGVRSRIFGFPRWKLSFYLPSADSLSSSNPATKMRWGRSVNEEQFYNNESEGDDASHDQVNYANTDNKDNIVCIYPREDDADHLLCMSPHNVTDQFYAISEPPSEDESDGSTKPNHTDVYLRSIRATEQGDYRVRKSKGGNFLRFGKATTFNRYDRGRDNFMRYGRSDMKRKYLGENFVRYGRAFQDRYDRSFRQGNSFVRYGRPSSVGTRQEQVDASTLFDHEAENDDVEDEWSEKDKHSKLHNNSPLVLEQRSRNNFLRLGRSEKEECAEDDEHCVDENARRYKRSPSDDCEQMKTCLDSFVPKGRKDNPELRYSNFKLRSLKNKSSSKGCVNGGGSSGEKCEVHSKWTDDVFTGSPRPIDTNS